MHIDKDFFRKLLFQETNQWQTQIFRYMFVGGGSFLVDYTLLFIFTEFFHLHYLLSASLSFIAGLIVNYLLSTIWIFRVSRLKNKITEFIIYAIIGIIGLSLNNILLYFFTDILHIHYMLSKIVTAVIVMGWNFAGRKIILFNR